jgi:hypothetical protein
MSKIEEYNSIKREIGTEGRGLVSSTIHSSFRIADAVKDNSSEEILASLTEAVSQRDINFTPAEKVILGHAAKGDNWSHVESSLNKIKENRDVERREREILRSVYSKIH